MALPCGFWGKEAAIPAVPDAFRLCKHAVGKQQWLLSPKDVKCREGIMQIIFWNSRLPFGALVAEEQDAEENRAAQGADASALSPILSYALSPPSSW